MQSSPATREDKANHDYHPSSAVQQVGKYSVKVSCFDMVIQEFCSIIIIVIVKLPVARPGYMDEGTGKHAKSFQNRIHIPVATTLLSFSAQQHASNSKRKRWHPRRRRLIARVPPPLHHTHHGTGSSSKMMMKCANLVKGTFLPTENTLPPPPPPPSICMHRAL